ncbi:MAG: DUF4190 domain-containing protein [Clostridia bacterium]|nr:DUF4190 domain-containing protein [Clostridia bacterium]
MFCGNCGKELCEEAVICPNCGILVDLEYTELLEKKKDDKREYNGFAVAGFSCAFVVPALGVTFGVIGLNKARRNGGKGKKLSIAAIVVSGIMAALYSAISSVLFV